MSKNVKPYFYFKWQICHCWIKRFISKDLTFKNHFLPFFCTFIVIVSFSVCSDWTPKYLAAVIFSCPPPTELFPVCQLKAFEHRTPIFSHRCKFYLTVTFFFALYSRGLNRGQGARLLNVKLQTASISRLTLSLGPVLDELSMTLWETWVRKRAPLSLDSLWEADLCSTCLLIYRCPYS